MRPSAYTYLATRFAAAEAGAAISKGHCPALAHLAAPCPHIPLAETIGSDVRATAEAMGLDEEVVDADVFEACARRWRLGDVLWWHVALDAYSKAAPFGIVAAEEQARRAPLGPSVIFREAA